MIQTIKGYYDNGIVVLEEQPKVKDKAPVFVMFIDDETENKIQKKGGVKIGGFEGLVKVPDDFNEPFGNYNAIILQKGGVKLGSLEGQLNISDDFDEPLN